MDIAAWTCRRRGYFWGTTVLVIPQCTGEPPMEFFMYPSNLRKMLPTLHRIAKLGKHEKW